MKQCQFPRRQPLTALIGVLLAAGAAQAQTTDAVDIDGISVTGVRASIQKSLIDKRNALGVVDAISAEDIGKFPDLNLSESLQRVSGITLDRNSEGEGRAINLRGLGPEFTRVEINGMSGMSNSLAGRLDGADGGRGFNFEIFASELFSKATVYKTGLAEVDEGGLAGTVRLETPRPLDAEGTRIVASALGNYGDLSGKTDPRTAVLFSHNHNDVFGIAASLAWSKSDIAYNTYEAASWRPFANANPASRIQATDDVRAAWNPTGLRLYSIRNERETLGSTLSLQFRPNETMTFSLDGLYGTLDNNREAPRGDMPIEGSLNAPTRAEVVDGIIVSGDFPGVQQRITGEYPSIDETYRQMTASLEWTPNELWTIRPSFGHVSREVERQGQTFSFRLAENGQFDPGTVSYRIRGDFLEFGSTHTNFEDHPEHFLFNVFLFSGSRIRDKENQARLDFDRHFTGNDHVLKFGLRYNDHTRERIASSWQLQRIDGNDLSGITPTLADVVKYNRYHVARAPGSAPSRLMNADLARVWAVFMPDGLGGTPIAGTRFVNQTGSEAQGTYTIQEKITSAWAQMDFIFDQWTLVPGMRFVRTEQISSGSDVANANLATQSITPVRYSKTYNGFLPNLTARYDVSDAVILRAAYARTLTRPNLSDLAPTEAIRGIDNSGGTGTRGNPGLEPYYAQNFDLGAEWYFSSEGLIAANVFYKKIRDFIDRRSFEALRTYPHQVTGDPVVDGTIQFTEPVNGVSATIKGVEVSMQSRFSKLPGAWGNFGGILNYSHTESSADFATENDVRSQGLPGLSKNSVNAVLYYDDGKLDARVSYAWRDRHLAQFVDNFGIPRFTNAYGQVDVSVNYHLNPHVSIQAQILNLTEEQRIDRSSARFMPYGVADIDRRFMLGVRVAF